MKILFIAPYPANESPSQRYRLEHYLTYLTDNNISYTYKPFLDISTWSLLFKKGYYFRKATGVFLGFLKRILQLFSLFRYDFIYIHREATPVGPPFFEWIAAKVWRKKIIYDFDDAIWIPHVSTYNKTAAGLKNFGKIAKICSWSYKVSVGNEYLAVFARRYNNNVIIVPTVVNTETTHNKIQDHTNSRPAIGWTGTFSTLPYLDLVMPVLKDLQETHDFDFVVIADKDPQLLLKNYHFIKWSREREADDLLRFHIGLMPLFDDEISKGKCGFKAIQYMSLGIPAVVSPVGVNSIIVENGVEGFVCDSDQDWKNSLHKLLMDATLRTTMGTAARKKIENNYSVLSSTSAFLYLFK